MGLGAILVAALVTACLLLFLGKAFHIDDPFYLWIAEQIQRDPSDFYGFEINWYGEKTPMAEVSMHPPLLGFYLAGLTALVGWRETAIHAGMLLPAISLVLGIHALASRLSRHPVPATLCACLTPVFLVSATTVMTDVLMLGFWCWATVLWLDGLERRNTPKLLAAAFLMGLCGLSKFFGMNLVPLLFAYTLYRERRLGLWAAWLLVPAAMMAGYDLFVHARYDVHPLLSIAGFSRFVRAAADMTLAEEALIGLFFLGGGLITSFFFVPLLWRPRALAAGAVVALLLAWPIVRADQLGGTDLLELEARAAWLTHAVVFAASGLLIGALVLADLIQRRDAGSILLALWIGGVFVFCAFANWTVTARAVLPAAPAVGILVARRLEVRTPAGGALPGARWVWPLLAGGVFSLLVAWSDHRLAASARTAAHHLTTQYQTENRTLWFGGAWGFQWYMQKLGAVRLDFSGSRLRKGDIIAIPIPNADFWEVPQKRRELAGTLHFPTLDWVSVFSKTTGAGFHALARGPLPFVFGPNPPERYEVWTVRRSGRLELRTGPSPLVRKARFIPDRASGEQRRTGQARGRQR
jgi:4-amino-4-deoxy-L-arabinose transferase-like glycosyltransferase